MRREYRSLVVALMTVSFLAGCAATSAQSAPTPTPTPVISQAQGCPPSVLDPHHWAFVTNTPPNTPIYAQDLVTKVVCGHFLHQPTWQALIIVQTPGSGGFVYYFVYDQITSAHPTKLYGDPTTSLENAVRVSAVGTILVGNIDTNSSINAGKAKYQWQFDLFDELSWSATQKTFTSVPFTGIFPDLTRYQAEDDQQQVQQGHDGWKRDPAAVATHAAQTLLGWGSASTAHLTRGGKSADQQATVTVTDPHIPHSALTVALSRLTGFGQAGIWEVSGITSPTLQLQTPANQQSISNPLIAAGTAPTGQHVTFAVFDHTNTVVGKMDVAAPSFQVAMPYTSSIPDPNSYEAGGCILAEHDSGGAVTTAVVVKETVYG